MESKASYKVLRRSSDFALLKKSGKRIRLTPWLLLSVRQIEEPELHCGWTISRKVANSVLRNRLKRWCREYFRQARGSLSGWQVNVVFLQQSREFYRNLERETFFSALDRATSRIGKH